jgi:hypothetical protein
MCKVALPSARVSSQVPHEHAIFADAFSVDGMVEVALSFFF